MGEHHALWVPGGPTGVHQSCKVITLHINHLELTVSACHTGRWEACRMDLQ